MKLKIPTGYLRAGATISTALLIALTASTQVFASTDSVPQIFVANWYAPGAIYQFTPGIRRHSTFSSGGLGEPENIAFDSSGNLFVADSMGNAVDEVTPDGTEQTFVEIPDPHGLAFDSAGDLFVNGNRDGNIYEIKRGSTDVTTFAGGLTAPGGMAFDKAGNLFVTSGGANGVVVEYKNNGGSLSPNETLFAQGIAGAADMAFDAAGNLYVGSNNGQVNGSQITKFTPQGDSSVYASGLNNLNGLVVDKNGNLYVSSSETVIEIPPGGGKGTVVAMGMGNATGIAIQDAALVPSLPSSMLLPIWPLLAAGFAILALLLLAVVIVLIVILARRKKGTRSPN